MPRLCPGWRDWRSCSLSLYLNLLAFSLNIEGQKIEKKSKLNADMDMNKMNLNAMLMTRVVSLDSPRI